MATKPDWEGECIGGVMNGDPEGVRRALALGMPVNGLVFESDKFTPLHYAVDRETKPAVVAALLEAGADVNARTRAGTYGEGQTPLMIAAYRGRLDLVKQLLAAGADFHAKAPTGIGAVADAAWGGKTAAREAVMRELLAAGARPDDEALTAAGRLGSPGMVRMLVAAGSDVNEVSLWGTALHLAVDQKRADTVEALLEAGADPNLRLPADHRAYPGKTALELAREKKLKKLVPLLEAAAAGTRPVATPPPIAAPADVATVWKRLEKALKAAALDVKKSLNRAATDAKLAKLEAALGLTLPADVRASYRSHDGQKDGADGLFPEGFADLDCEYVLLPVAGVLAEWEPWKELVEEGEFAGSTATPDRGVRDDWWNAGWVPVASNGGGDSLCIDLAPAEGGTTGQVIHVSHESGDRPRLAASFAELLGMLAEHYEEQADGG